MQTQITIALCLIAIALISIAGCNQHSGDAQTTEPRIIADGIINSLEYKLEDSRTGSFTGLSIAKAVPGGNGSWAVDAYGRLSEASFLCAIHPEFSEQRSPRSGTAESVF